MIHILRILRLCVIGVFCIAALGSVHYQDLPTRPPLNVLVQGQQSILTDQGLKATQSLLLEHQRLTGEEIVVAILETGASQKTDELVKKLFEKWGVGKAANNSGVLVVVFADTQEGFIEVGFGLEAVLNETKTGHLVSLLNKNLTDYPIGTALGQIIEQLLIEVGSPLASTEKSQKALSLLKTEASKNTAATPPSFAGVTLLIISLTCLIPLLFFLFWKFDLHFQAGKISRVNSFKLATLSFIKQKIRTGGVDGSW